MLNELFSIQNRVVINTPLSFKRDLHGIINWNHRLVIITGARGTGKTTLVLQHFVEAYNDMKKCLYISADNPIVLKTGIYKTAAEYFKYHGECLIVDEVHKQKDWSIDIKAIYDAYPDKKIIVLGSSTLNIRNEKGDLSRRGFFYSLQPLSFREYLELKYGRELPVYPLPQILSDHLRLSGDLVKKHKNILTDFDEFLVNGSYPFFLHISANEYFSILSNIIDKVIYEDISTVKTLKTFSSLKLKKLLGFVALSKIPLFNIESLKTEIEVSKDTLYEYFDLLDRAEIVSIVRTLSTNIRAFKNSKILFKTPNLYYAIAFELWKNEADKGNIRESFFSSQVATRYKIYSSLVTDFTVQDGKKKFEIEVGGRRKKKQQIKNLKNAFIFKDGIEMGAGNTVALYLAGFMY